MLGRTRTDRFSKLDRTGGEREEYFSQMLGQRDQVGFLVRGISFGILLPLKRCRYANELG